jgi:phosphatidylinositol alpha-1,6-mannosyltransferase
VTSVAHIDIAGGAVTPSARPGGPTGLLLTENFPPVVGGSARWFWELYRRMSRNTVFIAAGRHAGDVEFDATHDLPIARLPLSFSDLGILGRAGWRRYRAAARALAELTRQGDWRVHCGRVLPEGWIARGSGLPFGCYVHGEDISCSATSRQLTWMARRVMQRAALLIANSDYTAGRLEREWRVPRARIAVVRPGVDTTRFAPAPRDETARAAFGWTDRLVVLTVGRLQRRKGHDRMIEAIARLRERFPTLLYAIVGDGDQRADLEARARHAALSSHVRFYGELDDADLVRAYQQCDLFALPNRTDGADVEGFGMVLLEAQACGRAVLAGASGGTAEAVRAGESGVVVDCARAETLAAAVAELLSEPQRRARMGAAGRQWTVSDCSFDVLAPRAARVLERIAPR